VATGRGGERDVTKICCLSVCPSHLHRLFKQEDCWAGTFLCWTITTHVFALCAVSVALCVAAQGSFVLVHQEEESCFSEQGIPPLNLVMVGWQGARSTRAYIPVSDCVHYLRLCGADVSKYGKWYSSSGEGVGCTVCSSANLTPKFLLLRL
jgi:hypothetical protein